ncbi:MAG: glycosyltransferase [Patescibacteria group bacterium]|jgi:UDP-N-acetylglucosamine--N-acetylmuramyl-(pentapeptide) pyrophosphoryl-undecaprenol N-acetylglucosamine transferase
MAGNQRNETGGDGRPNKKIMFTGGGTGGSVTPLLAVSQELWKDKEDLELVFVGSQNGPEREMVANFSSTDKNLRFISLVAGKWRRYLSWQNFSDIFKVIAAFFKSLDLLRHEAPDLVVSAGSFISVPLVWAAAAKKIPVLIHQQDARPGLANRLMAPGARVITVNFEKSLLDYGPRAVCIGNPMIISDLEDPEKVKRRVQEEYRLDRHRPLILLVGGSLGAKSLNDLLWASRSALSDYQIINLSGVGKNPVKTGETIPDYYRILESLPHKNTKELISAADLVISRAGLGILTELSLFNKPAIIIPIPRSHQEDNAAVFARAEAAVVLDQKKTTPDSLAQAIRKILDVPGEKEKLANRIGHVIKRGAAASLAGIIWEILRTK